MIDRPFYSLFYGLDDERECHYRNVNGSSGSKETKRMAIRECIAGVLGAAGIFFIGASFAPTAGAAVYTAFGNPGTTSTTVTVTGATLVVPPYDPLNQCGSTKATSCNVANDDSGAIDTYRGTNVTNPEGGSSEKAERWYLSKLLNDSSLLNSTYSRVQPSGTDPGKASTFSVSAAALAGFAYIVLKYDGEWAFLKLDSGGQGFSVSGLPNGLSHYTAITPIPAAAWLFGSAFLGLCWLGRRAGIRGVGTLPTA